MKKIFIFTLLLFVCVMVYSVYSFLHQNIFLLISPFQASNFNSNPATVRLIDFNGKTYKAWNTKYQPLYSMFDKEGNLYVAEILPTDSMSMPGGGSTGLIEKINQEGAVVWSYENRLLSHDFDVLPNGNILVGVFSKLPKVYAKRIQGGFLEEGNDFWADTLLEINKEKKVVWSWKFEDHIKPEDYVLNPYTSRNEFTHTNSIKFYETNPLNHKPCVLISVRHLNTVFLIDKESGNILWKSPQGVFSFQHDASMNLEEGTIMAFDNGLFRKQKRPFLYSRVVKVNMLTNKVTWVFTGGESGPEMAAFSSSIMGGAQEIANGDVVVTLAVQGAVYEISKEKKIVASYRNTYLGSPVGQGILNNSLFKVEAYDLDFVRSKVLLWKDLLIHTFSFAD